MAFGGIPFYLSQFDNDLSVAQNIDAILFGEDAILSGEFDKLFKSQFENPDMMFLYASLPRVFFLRSSIARLISSLVSSRDISGRPVTAGRYTYNDGYGQNLFQNGRFETN